MTPDEAYQYALETLCKSVEMHKDHRNQRAERECATSWAQIMVALRPELEARQECL